MTEGVDDAVGLGLGDGLRLGDGEALGDGATLGDGVGRRPTGSGPTNTNAARIATATSTPVNRPATTVRAVFMPREGTSTDGRDGRSGRRW
jgi:hypothetical protein